MLNVGMGNTELMVSAAADPFTPNPQPDKAKT
jgi:hypothetical protein